MYKKTENHMRMSTHEASERFPDNFIIFKMDSMDISNDMGTILYIGDNYNELFSLITHFDDPSHCGVIEGLNHQCSLGGIVVNG